MITVMRLLTIGGGYPLLIAAAALMDLRRDVTFAFDALQANKANFIEALDWLLLAEWVAILAAARAVDWSAVRAKRWERVFGLSLAAYGLFGVAAISHRITMAVCGLIATKLAIRRARRLGMAITLIAAQYLPDRLLTHLHDVWARVDAWAVQGLLTVTGFPSDYNGPVVGLRGSGFAIKILAGCSTSSIVSAVAAAFLIFAVSWRAPAHAISRGLAVTVGACWVLNLLRLSLMVQSREDFHFWHDGDGTSIVSCAMTAIAFIVASSVAPAKAPRDLALSADAKPLTAPNGSELTS